MLSSWIRPGTFIPIPRLYGPKCSKLNIFPMLPCLPILEPHEDPIFRPLSHWGSNCFLGVWVGLSKMDKLFRFGRTHGFPTAHCVVILRVLSSPMMKTVGLTCCGQTTLRLSTFQTSLFPPTSKTSFKVSLWHALLTFLTPFFGLTIRVRALWSPHHNFFITNIRSHGTKPCGTSCGLYLAPKRSKFSSWRLCATNYPLKHSYPLVASMWILTALIATPLKRLYTFFEIAPVREKSGTNHWEYCPYPSFICRYKTG